MRSRIVRHSISLRPIMTDNSVAAPVHPAISRQTIPTSIIRLHAMTRLLALDRSREKAGLQVALQSRGHDYHRHGESGRIGSRIKPVASSDIVIDLQRQRILSEA